MTEQYNLYENAIAERINGILKQEFAIANYNIDLILKSSLIKNAVSIYNKQRPYLSKNILTTTQTHQHNS